MKRWCLPLLAVLMLLVLAGCGPKDPPPLPPQPEVEPPVTEPEQPAEPLVIESLTLELSRGGLSSAEWMEVVKTLPGQLQPALEQQNVTVKKLTLSVGTSTDATAEAVSSGGVELAFLPAMAAAKSAAQPLLVFGAAVPDCPEEDMWVGIPQEDRTDVGERMLICAAPTELGENLSQRPELTWEELSHARWGIPVDETSAAVLALEDWLRQRCDGLGLAGLPQVRRFDSYEDLLRAAAAGEVDVVALPQRVRADWAECWTLSPSRTDAQGAHGMGRDSAIWQELPVMAVTQRYYTAAVLVNGDAQQLQDPRFAPALAAAVTQLQAAGCTAFGMDPCAAAEQDALAFMAQLG